MVYKQSRDKYYVSKGTVWIMAKRLFSSSPRAEVVLADLRERDKNVSGYISTGVIDATVPVYASVLRHQALYLLDLKAGSIEDWESNCRINTEGDEELIERALSAALKSGFHWLADHPIDNYKIIDKIFARYDLSCPSGEALSERCASFIGQIPQSLQGYLKNLTPGEIIRTVLEKWEIYWKYAVIYNFLGEYVDTTKPNIPFEELEMVQILKDMEIAFILRFIK